MRVLQINAVYGVGSTGVIVEDLHRLSKEEGIESYVAYSTTNKEKVDNGYEIGGPVGKKAHALMTRITGKQGYYSHLATRDLLKELDRIQPDIVHLHNLHSNYIHLNMLLDYLATHDIATVVTLHDCWFYTGGCFHYTSVGCSRWKKDCGACPNQRNEAISHLMDPSRKVLRDRKKYFGRIKRLYVVGVSKWIEQEAKQTVFSGAESCCIYNGVDLDFFQPTQGDFRQRYGLQGKFLILGMANKFFLSINKETFDKLVAALKPNDRLVIVGCSEQQMKKLPEKVIGIPYICDRKVLREIYSSCDVFVNCTREESLSLVNVEAQACGTPVITYSNTGAKETVDGVVSLAVETGNPERIIEKIENIRESDYGIVRKETVKWAASRFEVRENYKQYISLYHRIFATKMK